MAGESATLDLDSCLFGCMDFNNTFCLLTLDHKLNEGMHLGFCLPHSNQAPIKVKHASILRDSNQYTCSHFSFPKMS